MSGTHIKKKSPLRVIPEGDFDKTNYRGPIRVESFFLLLKPQMKKDAQH
jgi:hypothetical protein